MKCPNCNRFMVQDNVRIYSVRGLERAIVTYKCPNCGRINKKDVIAI